VAAQSRTAAWCAAGRTTSIPPRSPRRRFAISNAAREALHQADVVETMLLGMLKVIKENDLRLAEELRRMDDTVDQLYSAIKYYLTKISREALGEEESRRWTDIISFTINMEQVGDIIERILLDIEDKKIRRAATSPTPAWPRSASCTRGCWTTCA
jgi:phosphate:Na+ symporter